MNIEIMRNTLYKAYLEDFYNFCKVWALVYCAHSSPLIWVSIQKLYESDDAIEGMVHSNDLTLSVKLFGPFF